MSPEMLQSSSYDMHCRRRVTYFLSDERPLSKVLQPVERRVPAARDQHRVASLMGAQARRINLDRDAGQIEPVGIPAGADSEAVMPDAVGMALQCRHQLRKGLILECDVPAAQTVGEFCRPRSVFRVPPLGSPAGIV